jgi:thymidine kinase
MAKLYFYYASMNAGKSTMMLQAAFNYRERGMVPMLFTAGVDDRAGAGMVGSRIGLAAPARVYDAQTDLFAEAKRAEKVDCVLIDEAQFLGEKQVWQAARVADELRVPVLAYGLRTDFRGRLFEGSRALLAIADVLSEIKAVCACGAKATMNLRIDAQGAAVADGAQTEIGGNERYVAMCRKHFCAALGLYAD